MRQKTPFIEPLSFCHHISPTNPILTTEEIICFSGGLLQGATSRVDAPGTPRADEATDADHAGQAVFTALGPGAQGRADAR